MLRRLLRGSVKIGLVAGVVAGLVLVGKKLMGGLGPAPGTAEAPKEWPSLVPEPAATASTPASDGEGEAVGPSPDEPVATADA